MLTGHYECGICGASGVKLWREYNTFLEHQSLYCLACANADQKKNADPTEDGKSLYHGEPEVWYRTAEMKEGWWRGVGAEGVPADAIETKAERRRYDQIGWLVPAVPTPDGESFWGYTSVPQDACQWWHALPYK